MNRCRIQFYHKLSAMKVGLLCLPFATRCLRPQHGKREILIKTPFVLLLLGSFCLSVDAVNLELAFQLGVRQEPTLDKLLPDVARQMAFNVDGTKLIANGMDGTLVKWNIQTQQKRTLGNIERKRWFAYSPQRNYLLIAKTNDQIVGLNVETNTEQPMMKGSYEVGDINDAVSLAALSRGDDKVELWHLSLLQWVDVNKVAHEDNKNSNVLRGAPVKHKTFRTTSPVRNGLTLSPSGRYIASAEGTYRDGEGHRTMIEVWNVDHGANPRWVFNTGEILGMWNLIFSPDETMLVVDTQHNNKSGIRVWDIHTGAQLFAKDRFEAYWTRAIAFVPNSNSTDTKYLVSGDEAGNLRVWNIRENESVIWETYPTGIQALAVSPNGKYLAVALWDATIQILQWRKNSE